VKVRANLTIPNLLTMIRLACLPTFVMLMMDDRVVAGTWFFALLGSTDWIDGYVARRFNQISELGKILDPVVDRVVFFVGITMMLYSGLPIWFGVAVLVREISIALVMLGGTAMGMQRFPVSRDGKRAAFALMAAVPYLTLGSVGGNWTAFWWIGWAVGVPGLYLSYKSFFLYLPTVKSHMSSRKSE